MTQDKTSHKIKDEHNHIEKFLLDQIAGLVWALINNETEAADV
jgi:hypothetical protein